MNLREHLSAQFSTVYITFLSVLIGFALEDLFSVIKESNELFELSIQSLIVWLQVFAVLIATVGGWMHSATVNMLRNSLARPIDAIIIFQFASSIFIMNATIGYDSMGWFWLAASYYIFAGAIATWGAVHLLRYEERDFSTYIESMLSYKGPIMLNAISMVFAAGVGYLLLQNKIPDLAVLLLGVVGCVSMIFWYFIVYRIWGIHIERPMLLPAEQQ